LIAIDSSSFLSGVTLLPSSSTYSKMVILIIQMLNNNNKTACLPAHTTTMALSQFNWIIIVVKDVVDAPVILWMLVELLIELDS